MYLLLFSYNLFVFERENSTHTHIGIPVLFDQTISKQVIVGTYYKESLSVVTTGFGIFVAEK